MRRGDIVLVTSGHDSGSICMIVAEESEGYVYIANGKQRPVGKPKKKNVKHLKMICGYDLEGQPTNKQLKRILSAYKQPLMGG